MSRYVQKNPIAQCVKFLYIVLSLVHLILLCFSYQDGMWYSAEACLYTAVIHTVITIGYGLRNLENRFRIVSFNAMYFLFLLSGLIATLLDGKTIISYLGVSEQAAQHTCYCLAISIIVVNLTYIALESFSRKNIKPYFSENSKTRPMQRGTRQIILVLFIVVLVAKFAGAVIQYRFLNENSYVDSYVIGYNKPFYITMPESVFYFCLCLWMATNPSKKQFYPLIVVVIVVEIIVLLSGDRAEPMATLFLLAYYVYNRSKAGNPVFRFTKMRVVVILALLPALILALQMVQYTRVHETVAEDTNLFLEFFEDQGVSVNVISKGYVYEEDIRQIGGSSYTIGGFRSYLTQNLISRTLFGIEAIPKNSVAAATSGNSFGSTLAYLWFRITYLEGHGCGSSYVAEMYHDGGIYFLCVGSALIAVLLLYLSRKGIPNGIYSYAFVLLMFKNLVLLPRVNSMAWFTATFSVQNLIVLVALLVANQLFSLHSNRRERATA